MLSTRERDGGRINIQSLRLHPQLGLGQRSPIPLLALPFFLHGSRGCFGCYGKSTPTTQVDEPSNRLTIQGQNRNNPSISDEFWSTSTFEMEQSGQRRITTSTPSLDQHGGASSHSPPEFINYGLVLWNQTREKWTENRRHKTKLQQVREPMLSWNATYENLLGTNKPFPQSMPLSVRPNAVLFTFPVSGICLTEIMTCRRWLISLWTSGQGLYD